MLLAQVAGSDVTVKVTLNKENIVSAIEMRIKIIIEQLGTSLFLQAFETSVSKNNKDVIETGKYAKIAMLHQEGIIKTHSF